MANMVHKCELTECFGNKCQYCTVLESEPSVYPCPFFKTRIDEADQVNRGYDYLLRQGRADLVQRYFLLGFMRKVNKAAGII